MHITKQLRSETEIQDAYASRNVASEYVSRRFASELQTLLHTRQVDAVNRIFRDHKPAHTLEVAPGPGRVTREVRPSGYLVCLEYNEAMITEGRAACRNGAEWQQGNAFELPFENNFDFLYSYRFVRHFETEDRQRLYAQFHKALKPGGHLLLDAVNQQVSAPLRKANPEAYPIYDKLYADERELREELQNNGFVPLRLEPVQRWLRLQSKAQNLLGPRSGTLCRLAVRTLEAISRGPALEWIVTCRRG